MKKASKELINILTRYILIIIAGLGNLWLIYRLLTPITVYGTGYILSVFYDVIISENVLSIEHFNFKIIDACIAGSAYYLLLALSFSTKTKKWIENLKLLMIGWGLLLSFNIIRIIILVNISLNGQNYFDIIHKVFWYGLSTIFVLMAWFISSYILKLKGIPVYSDFKYIIKNIKKSSRTKKKKN